jgi:hypothetical protein
MGTFGALARQRRTREVVTSAYYRGCLSGAELDAAEAVEAGGNAVARVEERGGGEAAGDDDVAGLQAPAAESELVGDPGEGRRGVAEAAWPVRR